MDIIAHALWANLIFKELPVEERSWLAFFSVSPDLISFLGITIKSFFKKTIDYEAPPLSAFPKYVFKLYNITHSLLVWAAVFFILFLLDLRLAALIFFGWGLHILLDVFTHTTKFFPTPILWPFSKFHFS
ncbi:MAG: metal-dependent hydrolase, partial [Candidatus Falkowbacteria bacterium]|nr:metal-dependent hydrolase [Candidatus Falkowbacteria bacterium]